MSMKLKAIGHFMMGMKTKKAWWYGITLEHSDRNSLSRIFGVSYTELMELFIEVGWLKNKQSASRRGNDQGKKASIAVRIDAINNFLQQSGLENDVEVARVAYKDQSHCFFIRLGSFGDDGPFNALAVVNDPAKNPPSVNDAEEVHSNCAEDDPSIIALQENLCYACFFVSPPSHLANTSGNLHNPNPSHTNKTEHWNTSNHSKTTTTAAHLFSSPSDNQPLTVEEVEENAVLQTLIQQTLFPTIFKEGFVVSQYWRDPSHFGNVVSAIGKISSFLIRRKEDKKIRAMGGNPTIMTPPKLPIKLPVLLKYGVPVQNKKSVQSVISECVTLSHNHPKHNLLTTVNSNGRMITLVEVPQSTSLSKVQRRNADLKWVDRMICALGKPERQKKQYQKKMLPSDIRWYDELMCNDEEQSNQTDEEDAEQLENNDDNNDEKEEDKDNEDDWTDAEVSAHNLLSHLCRKFPRSFRKVAEHRSMDIIKKPLDPIATFAMWSDANINIKQSRIIARHLRLWFDNPVVSSDAKWKLALNNTQRKFVQPICGGYLHKNEKIEWSYRDPVKIVLYFFNGLFNRRKTRKQWTSVDLVVSIDHGKGFSRAHLVIICRSRNPETGAWSEHSESFALANAKCKKDSYEVLKSTYMPHIDRGVGRLSRSGGLDVWKRSEKIMEDSFASPDAIINDNADSTTAEDPRNEDKEDDMKERFYVVLSGTNPESTDDICVYKHIPMEVISAGDIAQQMTNYGRDGFSGTWCLYCMRSKKAWQEKGNEKGDPWSLESLRTHLESLGVDEPDAQKRMGGCSEPLLMSVPIHMNSFPLLHAKLGVTNFAWDSFLDDAQAGYEVFTPKYLSLEYIFNKKADEHEFAKKQHQQLSQQLKDIRDTLRGLTNQSTERRELECKRTVNEYLLGKLDGQKKSTAAELRKARKAYEEEAKLEENARSCGQRVRHNIQTIAKKYGVNKGVYFGGDLQGPGCTSLLRNRQDIFSEVWMYLQSLPDTHQRFINDSTIKETIDGYELLFGHLDCVFSICSRKRHHVLEKDICSLVTHVEQACAIWRALQLSMTPKMHIIEDHLVEIVRQFNGIGDLGEDEGERGHQTGHQNELRCRLLHHKQKMKSIMEYEAMQQNGKVRERQDQVKDATRRARKVDTAAIEKKRKREDEREHLLSTEANNYTYPNTKELQKSKLRELNESSID